MSRSQMFGFKITNQKDRSTVVYNIAKTTRLNKIPGAVIESGSYSEQELLG
jgi:hypothetical protein